MIIASGGLMVRPMFTFLLIPVRIPLHFLV